MRNHIDAVKKLFEADETKTKKVTDIKFADPMSKGELTANRRGNTGVSSRDIFGTPGGKAATRATIKLITSSTSMPTSQNRQQPRIFLLRFLRPCGTQIPRLEKLIQI